MKEADLPIFSGREEDWDPFIAQLQSALIAVGQNTFLDKANSPVIGLGLRKLRDGTDGRPIHEILADAATDQLTKNTLIACSSAFNNVRNAIVKSAKNLSATAQKIHTMISPGNVLEYLRQLSLVIKKPASIDHAKEILEYNTMSQSDSQSMQEFITEVNIARCTLFDKLPSFQTQQLLPASRVVVFGVKEEFKTFAANWLVRNSQLLPAGTVPTTEEYMLEYNHYESVLTNSKKSSVTSPAPQHRNANRVQFADSASSCRRCLQSGHYAQNCQNAPALGVKQCNYCKLFGHLESECRKKKGNKPAPGGKRPHAGSKGKDNRDNKKPKPTPPPAGETKQ